MSLDLERRLAALERRMGQTEVAELPIGLSQLEPPTILGAGQATVGFVVPSGYGSLFILWQARGENASTSVAMLLRFNGDTGGNYDHSFNQTANSANTPVTATAGTSMRVGAFAGASAAAGLNGAGWILIPHYANTSLQRQVVSHCTMRFSTAAADIIAEYGGGNWRNAAAVTLITLLPSASNFAAGSRFTPYGIK